MYPLRRIHMGPPKPKRQRVELLPIVTGSLQVRRGRTETKRITILLDSGASSSIMREDLAKKLRVKTDSSTRWTTAAGTLSTSKKCKILFGLPELSNTMVVSTDIHLTKHIDRYDMILGRDLLRELGFSLDFELDTIRYQHSEIPMRSLTELQSEELNFFKIDESKSVTQATNRIKKILDAKYQPSSPQQIIDSCKHLNSEEKNILLPVLQKHSSLFDGTLGTWKGVEFDIELKDPNCKPVQARPFPVPRVHMETLLLEVNRLVEIGVLKRVNRSEWQSPSFLIPKKDETVRFISDFRELNLLIKRKPYPLPKIQELLLQLEGFKYGTTLDLNMGYYHIQLTPEASRLCTIVFPFGKYEYQKLPMGLCNSPDFFQEKMSDLMTGLEFVRTYLDDVAVLSSGTWTDHVQKVDRCLQRLKDAGLKINAAKSFFGLGEFEYLGYMLTREGVKPVLKKIQGIMQLSPPKTLKQLCSFLGLVNYYRDMWIRRSHILAPLTKLTLKKVKWH